MFFRFVMPFVVLLLALLYLFVLSRLGWSTLTKINVSIGAALLGFYLPDVFLNNTIARRQQSIMRGFPDALDLLLICVESGMSVDSSFQRVSPEIGAQSVELAEELA
jgi:tight adherence protein C